MVFQKSMDLAAICATLNDITFIIGKEEIEYGANRIFLTAITPVFEAMLYGNMKESKFKTKFNN